MVAGAPRKPPVRRTLRALCLSGLNRWTFHRAGPNKSDRPREVMTIIYVDADAKVIEPNSKARESDLRTWLPGRVS